MDYKSETLQLEKEITSLSKAIEELEKRRKQIHTYQISTFNYSAFFEEDYFIDRRLDSLYLIRSNKQILKNCLPIARKFEKFHISYSYEKMGGRIYKGSTIGFVYAHTIFLPILELTIILIEKICYYILKKTREFWIMLYHINNT